MKYKTRKTWKNVAGNQSAKPLRIYKPSGLDEIVAIIKEAEKNDVQVRAVGSGHSWSDVTLTSGYLIKPNKLTKILPLETDLLKSNTDNSTLIRFESGLRIRELNRELDRRKLALINMGGYDGQTFVGAMSTSTHGSGIELGPFSSFVKSMVVVDGEGSIYQVEPKDGITDRSKFEKRYPAVNLVQDDEWFNALTVNMGCMGIIYSLIITVTQKYWLREVRTLSNWDSDKEELKKGDVLKANRHYEILVNPHAGKDGRHKTLITTRNPASPGKKRSVSQKSRSFLDAAINSLPFLRRIAVKLLRIFTFGLLNVFKLIPAIQDDFIDIVLDGMEDRDGYFDISYKVFNIGIANELPAISSEIALPLDNDTYIAGIDRFLQLAEENRIKKGLYHTAPVALRFVKKSNAFLSMMQGRDTCMVEIIMARDTSGLFRMLDGYENGLYSFSGRPHWGQLNSFKDAQKTIKALYPEYNKWLSIYKQLNKNGRFDNHFTKRVRLDG